MKTPVKDRAAKSGFALIEILIAAAILSIVLLSVFTGVSSSIYAMAGSQNYTRAIIIARSQMNDFIMKQTKMPDCSEESLPDYPGFYISRQSRRFDHAILGPIPARITEITISWKEKDRSKNYKVAYIYATK